MRSRDFQSGEFGMARFIRIRQLLSALLQPKPNRVTERPRIPHRQTFFACLFYAWLGLLISGLPPSSCAQNIGVEDGSADGSQTALNVVRWSGSLPQAAGRTAEVLFSLYQNKSGGLPLCSETQTVNVSADGRYSVLLGSASREGLPQALFQRDDARWMEAHSIAPQPLDRGNAEPVQGIHPMPLLTLPAQKWP